MKIIRNGIEIELTENELYQAYEEQEHIYDVADIESVIDDDDDALMEDYSMSREQITALVDEMAYRMRKYIERGACFENARDDAITDIVNECKQMDTTQEEDYIAICSPNTLAFDLIADLGTGPTTENGDRSSQYFAIARGRNQPDQYVSVSLTENINELPEGKGYYSIHSVDDVDGKPCEMYYTDDLSESSLVNLLAEILDELVNGGN